jgi:hypothetical protein
VFSRAETGPIYFAKGGLQFQDAPAVGGIITPLLAHRR